MTSDTTLNINDLNDYCLLNIIKYLPLREKFILSSTSKNLKRIFFLYVRTNREYYLDLNYDIWSLSDIQITFNLIGKYIEEIQINENNKFVPRVQTCLDFIIEYCKNLRILQLNTLINSRLITNEIVKKFQNLEILQIFKGSLTDLNIQQLTNLKNLKELDLSENHEITGKYFDDFNNLQILKLYNCTNLKKTIFLKVFKHLNQLQYLDLEQSTPICNTLIGIIIDNCKLLVTLKIRITINNRNSTNWHRIKELKSLKSLSIEESWNYHGDIQDIQSNRNIINNLLINLSEQLEYLKIYFKQIDHDKGYNRQRFNAIFQLRNLKELHLIGYLSCYVVYWRELTDYVNDVNTNLKIIKFIHTNSMLDFGEANLIEFLENAKKLDEIKIIYPNTFLHMPFFYKFLDKLVLKRPVFQTKFTLNIKVGEKTKNKILRNTSYLSTRELFNLEINLSHSDNTPYPFLQYHDGESDEDIDEMDHGDNPDQLIEIINHDNNQPGDLLLNEVIGDREIIHEIRFHPPGRRPRNVSGVILNDIEEMHEEEIVIPKFCEKTIRIVLNPDLM